MIEIRGKGGIVARIIADSMYRGKRITTYELVYPRFIHSEKMTHRMLSKNAASSRAIPVEKQIENILAATAMPIHWGKNQPGMSAKEEHNALIEIPGERDPSQDASYTREQVWNMARDAAIKHALMLHRAGYHKQIVNRLLEPFVFMKTVCTGTEFANLFHLRCHPDAQPEFQELARCMKEAYDTNIPVELDAGDWHTPYYGEGFFSPDEEPCDCPNKVRFTLEDALMISASCCAQVSYRKNDDSIEKARDIYKRLVESKPMHASPFEHQATPINSLTQKGITHYSSTGGETGKLILWSGNFKGWVQHRQLISDHVVW